MSTLRVTGGRASGASSLGRNASSSGGEYGSGVSSAATMRTGVEPLERFFLNDGCDRFADAAGARVLVHDQHLARFPRHGENRRAVERRERSKIEHARMNAVFGETPVATPAGATSQRSAIFVGATTVAPDRFTVT